MNRRPRFDSAHVIAAVALFVALGGTALALERNSVTSKEIKNESVKGKDIRDGQVRGSEVDESTLDVVESALATVPDAAALGGIPASGYQRAAHWAVVDGTATDATVVRGTATGAGRTTTAGQYFVTFPPDISGCAFIATSGSVDQSASTGEVSVESSSTLDPTTTVEVRHRDSASGALTDFTGPGGDGFHIAVIC
jgi:hypothetical protein